MLFPHFLSTEDMADHVRETFNWHLRGPACLSQPLLENYHDLCLGFNLSDAEEAVRNFRIPKMVQAVFCAMVVNKAFKLGVLSRDLVEHLKSSVEGLQWYMCEAWLQLDKHTFLCVQYHTHVNPRAGPKPTNDQAENSGLSDAPPLSGDDK